MVRQEEIRTNQEVDMKHYYLKKWCKKLNIKDKITFEYISKDQVVCAYNRPYRLVGISNNIIYHDRRLTELDIVHELCHVKYPELPESDIRGLAESYLFYGVLNEVYKKS